MAGKPQPIEFRLSRLIDRTSPDECWLWRGYRNKKGYGRFRETHAGLQVMAHRFIYERYVGPIPEGISVLHRCDNPPCCNQGHLFLGTSSDNNADRHAKGRSRGPKGERAPSAKLQACDVLKIRLLATQGMSNRNIARQFHVSSVMVGLIVRRLNWKHI